MHAPQGHWKAAAVKSLETSRCACFVCARLRPKPVQSTEAKALIHSQLPFFCHSQEIPKRRILQKFYADEPFLPACTKMLTVPCSVLCGIRTRRLSAIAQQPFSTWLMTPTKTRPHKPTLAEWTAQGFLSVINAECEQVDMILMPNTAFIVTKRENDSSTINFLNQPQCNRLAKFLTWIRMLRMNRA